MNNFDFFLDRFFYKSQKSLLFYLIAAIIYIFLIVTLVFLMANKSPYVFLLFFVMLTFTFLLFGVEIGIILAGIWIVLSIIGMIFIRELSGVLTSIINIILTSGTSFLLSLFIIETDTRKKNIEIRSIDIQRKIIEKKEEYDKIKSQIEGNKTRIKNYTLLNEVAQKLAITLEKEEIYKIILNYISPLLNNKKVNFEFLIWNEESGIYECLSEKYNTTDASGTIKLYKKDSFDEWVEVNKHTLFIKNIDEDYRFKIFSKKIKNFKSMVSIPLLVKQKVICILKVHSDKVNFFDNDDARILNYLGDLCTTIVQNSLLYSKTKELAIKDGLTGLYMRRYFIEKLDEEIRRVKQLNNTFSFLMIDIDHFKECNDTYGHLFGDKVLRVLGEFLKENLRDVDIIGRYGGEEFAVILPNTNYNGATFVAERLRSNFEKLVIKVNENEGRKITLSIGGIEYKNDMKLMEVINRADKALYHSKETGRNKVTFWEDIQ